MPLSPEPRTHASGDVSDTEANKDNLVLDRDNVKTFEFENDLAHSDVSDDRDPDFVPVSSNSDSDEIVEDLEDKNSRTEEVDMLGTLKPNGEIRKGNKKKDFCRFCESYVLNFARHILGAHTLETEVHKISSLPPKDPTRKKLLSELRKQGNFLNSCAIKKPVRQPQSQVNLLPCSNCRGFFSSKQLWRHRIKCMGKSDKKHKAKAQDLLLKNVHVDKQLREQVFPRMRPDEISLIAKSDQLICAYGTRYLKSHREKHFINVTSRKMRELARLLIEIKKLKPTIKNFFLALKPEYFGLLVSATKIVAQYNVETDCYESATTALNLGTAIKQCAQHAIYFILKKKDNYSTIQASETEADLKSLIQLIDSEWKFEVSTQASNDLHMKKWNKISMVPLASDLKIMRDFLISKAKYAVDQLKANCKDKEAYKILLETVFCRILLLNRRRPGELQRLPVHTYQHAEENNQGYEEFSDLITPSEKILLRGFKRIIIRGKRGRGVPVLFSSDIQSHIEILLQQRKHFFSNGNTYLFGNPGTLSHICGYKVISKYARSCGAKNPHAITATKLRKHLATLTQVLNMSENDIEQLSAFMGHTVNIHRGSYRLPDDVFQTAKISKVLLLMEKGEAAQYKGKSLEEINVDMNIDYNIDDSDIDETTETEPLSKEVDSHSLPGTSYILTDLPTPMTSKSPSPNQKPIKRVLIPWTDEQKKVTRDFFSKHIKSKIPPKKQECLTLIDKYPSVLKNKNWQKIKVFVHNEYSKHKNK